MNYYKSEDGEVFAYDDEQVTMGLADDKAPMTPAEVDAHLNPPKTADQIQLEINTEARAYLLSTDWYVIRSQETGESIPVEILAERQAARDKVVE
jgi:hypothetical protein